jgi:hypothetical protein
VYDTETRRYALTLLASGQSQNAVSKRTGISRAALRARLRDPEPRTRTTHDTCFRCAGRVPGLNLSPDYAYLLGLYLGDGCLSRAGRDVWALRVFCADAWPGLLAECRSTMERVVPGNRVCLVTQQGCKSVQVHWKHWPCLFPQHGPGRKHHRRIVLEPWQDDLVATHPQPLLRGLFHSDGCRITNWTTRTVAGKPKRYEYPRYLFSNRSEDILDLCGQALDRLDIAYGRPKAYTISVARRAAVASLDTFVGPKY